MQVVDNRFTADAQHKWGGMFGAYTINDQASISAWSGNTLAKLGGGKPVTLPPDNSQP